MYATFTALVLWTAFAADTNVVLAKQLSGIDNLLSPKQLAGFSHDPAADLIVIAEDASLSPYVRERAVALLGGYPDARVSGALLAFAASSHPGFRLKALKALRRLAVTSEAFAKDETIAATLADRLVDNDLAVRLAAVRALAVTATGRVVLARQLNIEQEPAVRDTIGEVLAR